MTTATSSTAPAGVTSDPAPTNRYILVTVVATPLNLGLLYGTLALTGVPPITANIAVASAVAVPSFVACKRWVWQGRLGVGTTREALAFWVSTVTNVALATLTVRALESADPPRALLSVVPTGVYTITWLARFLVLDRLVFRRSRPVAAPAS